VRSRRGTGFVIVLGLFASTGVIAASAQSFLGGAQAVSSQNRINGKPASSKKLDGWIRDALVVMEQEKIPGSYQGLHKNIIRESGGNPTICNTTDINARNGTPSCGLLQVIQPTFNRWKLPQSAYDRAGVKAEADNLTDPVANLVTAANYAWHRYPGRGGIDGIDGPY
jgi:hypothetical protein